MEWLEVGRTPEVVQLLTRLAILIVAVEQLASDSVDGKEWTCFREYDEIDSRRRKQLLQSQRKADAVARRGHRPLLRLNTEIDVRRGEARRCGFVAFDTSGSLTRTAPEDVQRRHAKALAQIPQARLKALHAWDRSTKSGRLA